MELGFVAEQKPNNKYVDDLMSGGGGYNKEKQSRVRPSVCQAQKRGGLQSGGVAIGRSGVDGLECQGD